MSRPLALALAALSTLLFVEGIALGGALGVDLARSGEWPALGVDWSELAEIALWVALLMTPAVAYLRTRRHQLWIVTGALSLGIALVAFARFRLGGDGRFDSLFWAALEGLAFALGLLFFDLVAGLLERTAHPAAPGLDR